MSRLDGRPLPSTDLPAALAATAHTSRPSLLRCGRQVLRFIGSRPLVGYYLEFDVAVLNRHVRPKLGIPLPNRQIEVSALYYDTKARRAPPDSHIDLRFATIREELGLPERAEHDAFNDALLAAMMYVRLRGSGAGPG